MTNLKPKEKIRRCPNCDSDHVSNTVITHRCYRCGYLWNESLLDKQEPKPKEERDKIETIIYAYAVNYYNAPEGDWSERKRVRNLALDDLEELIENRLKAQEERIEKRIKSIIEGIGEWQEIHKAHHHAFYVSMIKSDLKSLLQEIKQETK